MAWLKCKAPIVNFPLPESYPPLLFNDGNWNTYVNRSATIAYNSANITITTNNVTQGNSKEGSVLSSNTYLSKSVNSITITVYVRCWGDFDGSGRNAWNGVQIQSSDDGITWTTDYSLNKSISWGPSSYNYNTTLTQTFGRPTGKYFRLLVRSYCGNGTYGGVTLNSQTRLTGVTFA